MNTIEGERGGKEEGKRRVGSFHSENRSNRCREAVMTCPPFFPASSFFLSLSPFHPVKGVRVNRVSFFVRANV